jgi:hypothetical protein
MIELVFEFILVGLVGGLLGLFYRNCLKPSGMIFNFIYYGWLKPWAECTEDIVEAGFKPKAWDKFKAWIARPLGYCIYCSTFWITFILCIIAGSYKEGWNSYSEMLIAYITALSVQHLVVAMSCRWLINKHPDLDTTV